jgi:hypothetical protein
MGQSSGGLAVDCRSLPHLFTQLDLGTGYTPCMPRRISLLAQLDFAPCRNRSVKLTKRNDFLNPTMHSHQLSRTIKGGIIPAHC